MHPSETTTHNTNTTEATMTTDTTETTTTFTTTGLTALVLDAIHAGRVLPPVPVPRVPVPFVAPPEDETEPEPEIPTCDHCGEENPEALGDGCKGCYRKCSSCGDTHPEDDSCEHCYYCDRCGEMHDPDSEPYCESCANQTGRRHRVVCTDRCDSCFYCEYCSERHHERERTQCSRCDGCTDDHDCAYCENCSEYGDPDSNCGDCDRCENCGCECNDRIRFVRNPVVFHYGKPTALMPSTRMVSVEFEISKAGEGDQVNRVVDHWSSSVVEDGSVSGGVEICTAPSSGDKFTEHMGALTRAFDSQNATVDHRCGAHIHLDARDFRWRDIGKLLWLYAYLEEALFSLVPARRRDAQWCERRAEHIRHVFGEGPKHAWSDQAWKTRVIAVAGGRWSADSRPAMPQRGNFWCADCSDYAQYRACEHDIPTHREAMRDYERAMVRYARATKRGEVYLTDRYDRIRDVKPVKGSRKRGNGHGGMAEGKRYYALNLQSWWKHGTVEIRLHGGTTEFDKIVAWSALWARVMDFVKKASLDEVIALAKRDDPWAVLMELAPEPWRAFLTERRDKFAR